MNDINLKHTSDNRKWDWDFNYTDLNVVHGKYQRLNAVKHAILLKNGELRQAIYTDKGSNIHDYTKMPNEELQHDLVRAALESTAEQVQGIYDAMVAVEEQHPYENHASLHLITEEMEEITLTEVEI
jgi:hypothetical protein